MQIVRDAFENRLVPKPRHSRNQHGQAHYVSRIRRPTGILEIAGSILGPTRAATICSLHDTIRITILASRYDIYRDTLFRLEIISNCMRIILWSSTMVFTILQSLLEIVQSYVNIFVKVL